MLSEKVRIFDKKVTEIRVSEIRVSEIRISSNHRELHGAIFLEDKDIYMWKFLKPCSSPLTAGSRSLQCTTAWRCFLNNFQTFGKWRLRIWKITFTSSFFSKLFHNFPDFFCWKVSQFFNVFIFIRNLWVPEQNPVHPWHLSISSKNQKYMKDSMPWPEQGKFSFPAAGGVWEQRWIFYILLEEGEINLMLTQFVWETFPQNARLARPKSVSQWQQAWHTHTHTHTSKQCSIVTTLRPQCGIDPNRLLLAERAMIMLMSQVLFSLVRTITDTSSQPQHSNNTAQLRKQPGFYTSARRQSQQLTQQHRKSNMLMSHSHCYPIIDQQQTDKTKHVWVLTSKSTQMPSKLKK